MKLMKELSEEMFRNDTFLQNIPSERSRIITQDDLDSKSWQKLNAWVKKVRDQISEHKDFKIKGWTIRDLGASYSERFPCPLSYVEVLTKENGIVRYAVTAFFDGKSILLSYKRLSSSDTVPVSGINLDNGAAWLTNEVRRICLPLLCRKTVVIDRRPLVEARLKANMVWAHEIDPTELAQAIQSTADVGLFLLIHAVGAAISSFLPDTCRFFYYASVICSGTEKTAKLQTDALRKILAAFTFAQGLEAPVGLVPEITVQSQGDLELLQKIPSIPVLVHVDLDAIQKKLTTIMQSAQTDLAVSGQSRYPFGTVPLLVGSELPTEHISLRLTWSALEPIDWDSIDLLRTATADILCKPQCVANCIASAMLHSPLSDRTYPVAQFLIAAKVLDTWLLEGSAAQGALLQRAENIVDQIWNDEEVREKRFATALDMLIDSNTTAKWVAESVKEMEEGQIGFQYAKQDGTRWVAFELKEAFPQLLLQLGLKKEDSSEFRTYLKKLGVLEQSSDKIRGQAQKPSSHVLFAASKLGYEVP